MPSVHELLSDGYYDGKNSFVGLSGLFLTRMFGGSWLPREGAVSVGDSSSNGQPTLSAWTQWYPGTRAHGLVVLTSKGTDHLNNTDPVRAPALGYLSLWADWSQVVRIPGKPLSEAYCMDGDPMDVHTACSVSTADVTLTEFLLFAKYCYSTRWVCPPWQLEDREKGGTPGSFGGCLCTVGWWKKSRPPSCH